MSITLTVFFDDPFWVGVFERRHGEDLMASRIVFGAEPKDFEVYDWVLHRWNQLRFSAPVADEERPRGPINPKRLQRMVRREVAGSGIGTKAQEALKLSYEAAKREGQIRAKLNKEAHEDAKFEMRQKKKREKHKGH